MANAVRFGNCRSFSVKSRVINVRYERGVFLPEQDLWLDPWDAKPFAFVSHAHSDHIAAHDEIIVSERTARLMQARLPGERNEHVLAFAKSATVRGFDVMLLPAGHIFGSAQFFLERPRVPCSTPAISNCALADRPSQRNGSRPTR